jgi:cytochrome c peroxidase
VSHLPTVSRLVDGLEVIGYEKGDRIHSEHHATQKGGAMEPRMAIILAWGLVVLPGLAAGEAELASIGKRIFFDRNLSQPAGQACASCHDPTAGFADPNRDLPVSRGVLPERLGSRNAQSVAYAAFSPSLHYDPTPQPGSHEGMYVGGFFWDGRAKRLEDQVKEPFLNPLEMHNPDRAAVMRSVGQAPYAGRLSQACGVASLDRVEEGYDCVAKTLAAYLRSPEVSPFTSKFDAWRAGKASLTEAEARGFALFTDKAKCSNCHAVEGGPDGKVLFTNFGHQNTGIPRKTDLPFYRLPSALNPAGEKFVDLGLGDALRKAGNAEEDAAREDGKFKIPSLRNCAVTPPYMHNGVFKTLREVVVFNNTRDVAQWPPPEVPRNIHRHMHPMPGTFGRLGLTDPEIDALVEFLKTLTDGYRR